MGKGVSVGRGVCEKKSVRRGRVGGQRCVSENRSLWEEEISVGRRGLWEEKCVGRGVLVGGEYVGRARVCRKRSGNKGS